jgi:aspartate-semialdehyde dehydrogenase
MRIAVVGATGLVGREMLKVLAERSVHVSELIPVASAASVGKTVHFNGKDFPVVSMEHAIGQHPDFALFSAGGSTSLEWAPKFAEVGTVVIDNSSAWRMDPQVPLVVPEVNFDSIHAGCKIIANPNCSTIQLVVALSPLHRLFGIERVVVSTYQSVSGTGKAAIRQLEEEESGLKPADPAYAHQIHRNCIPHCDVFLENGYTKEEMKLVNESRKILGAPELRLTATAVRVPVIGGHSEAVNVAFKKPTDVNQIRSVLSQVEGLKLQDEPLNNIYPMPKSAHETDSVYVGRIRRDESAENTFNMWVVADNLRKGAATNAIQILQKLIVE